MNYQHNVVGPDYTPQSELPGEIGPPSSADPLIKKPLTQNDLLVIAYAAVREGKMGPYYVFEQSVSCFENPIQLILRHEKTGRLKIANIDRVDGSVSWDNSFIPWK
jgi:hypothetical protein